MKLTDLRIATLLRLGLGLLAMLMAAVGTLAVVQLRHIGSEFSVVTDDRLPRVEILHDIKDQLNEVARAMRNTLIMAEGSYPVR